MASQIPDHRPWADLPNEMLSSIVTKIEARHDVLHFRAVCTSWRKIAPFPKRSSLSPLDLRGILDPASHHGASYILTETTVFQLELDPRDGSGKKCCLIKLQEQEEDGKFQTLSPFSKFPLKNRPEPLPEFLDIRDFGVSVISNGFNLERIPRGMCFIDYPDSREIGRIYKAVITSNFEENANVLFIQKGELWRIDVDHKIRSLMDRKIELRDIVNFNQRFYSLDRYGIVTGYEQNSMNLIELFPRPTRKLSQGERYFVQSKGDLFTVHREFSTGTVYFDKEGNCFVKEDGNVEIPIGFRVFKGEKTEFGFEYNWEEVKDLGERVFFLSHDCSFSFSAHDFPGCRGNCIVYVDQVEDPKEERFEIGDEDDDGEELDELKNGKVGVFFIEDGRYEPIANFPEYLSIFWPLPSWLRSGAGGAGSYSGQ